MALPGLNTEGTRISVLPQYTPSNTALDLSALGSGLQQGMQIVGQAQQARRLRDIIAEEQANAPLRQAQRLREIEIANSPIERSAGIGIERTPDGDLIEVENVEAFVPGGRPYTFKRPSRLIETAAQATQRTNPDRPFAPEQTYQRRADGGYDLVLVDRNPGSAGKIIGRTENVIPPQSFMPDAPKPETVADDIVEVPDGRGGIIQVALLRDQQGNRFYRGADGVLLPFNAAPVAPKATGKSSAADFISKVLGEQSAAPAAPTLPGLVAQPAAPVAVPAQPAPRVIRVDPSSVYGTR